MKKLRLTTYDLRLNTGFTLIELLIAVSIFSIVILSIYSAFQTGILSYRKIDSAFETYQTARIVFNRMELDLKNSFVYGDAKGSGFIGESDPLSLEFFSVVDSYEEGEPRTDICRIRYDWDENKKILKRACYTGLDTLKTDTPETGIELASNIEKIIFEYAYPTSEKDKPYDWQKTWPNADDEDKKQAQEKSLPLAVKITLFLIEKDKSEKGKPGEEKPIEFNKTISLPLGETTPVEGTT